MKVGFHLDHWLQENKFTPPYEAATHDLAVIYRGGKKMIFACVYALKALEVNLTNYSENRLLDRLVLNTNGSLSES
ncbi:MAG: hypothetical protein ACREVA_03060 [Burkholderiales bacterium]